MRISTCESVEKVDTLLDGSAASRKPKQVSGLHSTPASTTHAP